MDGNFFMGGCAIYDLLKYRWLFTEELINIFIKENSIMGNYTGMISNRGVNKKLLKKFILKYAHKNELQKYGELIYKL